MARLCVLLGVLYLFTFASESLSNQCTDPKVLALQSIANSVDSKGSQLVQVIENWYAAFQENKKILSQRDQKFLDYLNEHRAVVAAIAQSIQTETFLNAIKRIDGVLENLNKTFQSHQEHMAAQVNALQLKLESDTATLMENIVSLNEENKILQSGIADLMAKISISGVSFNMTATKGPCSFPFKEAGNECLHLGLTKMNWTASRDYCKGLGGDLMVPSTKSDIVLQTEKNMTHGHHIVFDLLQERRARQKAQALSAWIGATVVNEGTAEWISPYGGTLNKETGYTGKLSPGDCVRALVNNINQYAVWDPPCTWQFIPVCQLGRG